MRVARIRTLLAVGLVGVLAACTPGADAQGGAPDAGASSPADASARTLTVQPREGDASDQQIDVGGVLLDVPAGLEVRPADDGVSTKVGLHAPGRERAVLVLSVTEEQDGVTDGDVDLSRDVFEHQIIAAGLADEVTRTGVRWPTFAYAVGVELDLLVDDDELPLAWVVGRDEDGARLVTVHVEADPGQALQSTPAYDALRTVRFG